MPCSVVLTCLPVARTVNIEFAIQRYSDASLTITASLQGRLVQLLPRLISVHELFTQDVCKVFRIENDGTPRRRIGSLAFQCLLKEWHHRLGSALLADWVSIDLMRFIFSLVIGAYAAFEFWHADESLLWGSLRGKGARRYRQNDKDHSSEQRVPTSSIS